MNIKTIVDPITESNSYIVVDEERCRALVIDPNFYEGIEKIIVNENLQLDKIILTHEHYDHISGLNELRKNYSVEVVASASCSEGIQDVIINKSKTIGVYLHFIGKPQYRNKIKPYVCQQADIIFTKHLRIFWNSHILELYETPGHSAGGTCIVLDNKYLFTGDSLLLLKETITSSKGGNTREFEEKTLPFLKSLDKNLKVFPGHGESFILKARLA